VSALKARGFDPSRAYGLSPEVALRDERFGAMAYHYGNRRLVFLCSREVVTLVRDLEHHGSIDAALAASSIASDRWSTFRKALQGLAESEVIRGR
jgi:putative mycofactocin binding protein MftB